VASAFRRKIHRHTSCSNCGVSHPYPPHMEKFSYVGKYRYFLTLCTYDRRPYFERSEVVQLVREQILRATTQEQFLCIAYCYMPDHLHLLVEGVTDGADLRMFIKAAKQYSGYYFKQLHGQQLWQRYGYEHVLRDDIERATTLRYILDNPVNCGLTKEPEEYPFLGSDCYSVEELLQQATRRS
jgi:REP-associated tyrosine transposase